MNKDKYLTPREAAEKIGISYDYMIRLINKKRIEGAKQWGGGARWVIPMSTVDALIEEAPFHAHKRRK